MIIVKEIQFSYENQPKIDVPDLELNRGDELLVLGKSGSGKTTLLNILGGLQAPHKGEVWIDGISLYGLKGNDLDKFRGSNIGIVFQKPHLLGPLTVSENICLPHFFANKPTANKLDYYLEELGIQDKKDARIQTLSEGEAQRVSIARAMVNEPKVILADEPTASLDDDNARMVVNLLKNQAKKLQATLIIVTHDYRIKDQIDRSISIKSGSL